MAETYKSNPNAGRPYIKGIFDQNRENLLGVVMLSKISRDNNQLFSGADPAIDRELSFFVDADLKDKGIEKEVGETVMEWAREKIGIIGLWAAADPYIPGEAEIFKTLEMDQVQYRPKTACTDSQGNMRPRLIYLNFPSVKRRTDLAILT